MADFHVIILVLLPFAFRYTEGLLIEADETCTADFEENLNSLSYEVNLVIPSVLHELLPATATQDTTINCPKNIFVGELVGGHVGGKARRKFLRKYGPLAAEYKERFLGKCPFISELHKNSSLGRLQYTVKCACENSTCNETGECTTIYRRTPDIAVDCFCLKKLENNYKVAKKLDMDVPRPS